MRMKMLTKTKKLAVTFFACFFLVGGIDIMEIDSAQSAPVKMQQNV